MARFEIISPPSAQQVIVAAASDPAFAPLNANPLTGGFARCYYPKVFQDSCSDLSFAIALGGQPVAIVPMTLIDGALSYFGQPVPIFIDSTDPELATTAGVRRVIR